MVHERNAGRTCVGTFHRWYHCHLHIVEGHLLGSDGAIWDRCTGCDLSPARDDSSQKVRRSPRAQQNEEGDCPNACREPLETAEVDVHLSESVRSHTPSSPPNLLGAFSPEHHLLGRCHKPVACRPTYLTTIRNVTAFSPGSPPPRSSGTCTPSSHRFAMSSTRASTSPRPYKLGSSTSHRAPAISSALSSADAMPTTSSRNTSASHPRTAATPKTAYGPRYRSWGSPYRRACSSMDGPWSATSVGSRWW